MPTPLRSTRSLVDRQSAPMTMSFSVLPSPMPSSGSSLDTWVITASAMPRPASQLSVTRDTSSAIVNVWYLWFGGASDERARRR